MNYLAHCFLSHETPEAVVGSLLGDFVKGRVEGRFEVAICHSITLHRKIDSFTDSHGIFLSSKRLIRQEYRRYAGIMIDLFYDHYLARHWQQFSDIPLERFTQQVYEILDSYRAILPAPLLSILPRMSQDDWLSSYRETWAIEAALHGVARRLRHKEALLHAVDELSRNHAALQAHFFDYFPQLIDFVADYKNAQPWQGSP